MATKSQDRRKVRLSRALGVALTPKAARYLEKRPYGPGEHGRTKRKQDSDYAVRLREKQRLREQYGIREAQLRIQFEEARRKDGLTGENLVEQLEQRLDALVVRAGFARTMAQARQFVVHRHIMVDGQLVDRPSFRVKPGQLIHVKQRSEGTEPFQVAAAGGNAEVLPRFRPTSRSTSTSCRPASCVARSAPRCPWCAKCKLVVEYYAAR
ncbi:30S ribosomal protein S4 [Microbacterium elymi]|uniref:Small ribosomal subunit protein uS4 n=1 Tax=Microbacterium elymi TaxID=2909587 RepID=A0ABY3SUM9_9MICO|nr:30S ribosomal protein S4 [Microbacterium elymi]UJP12601.2 30S ribosomal protein S4 [Microbacterium elymi]